MYRMYGTPRAHGCAGAVCVSYVQDERYAAGAGSAGAACVNFAQRFLISMGAKVVQCLISGHAVNPSMGARTRLPVSYGPETRHHTPSASWVSFSAVDSDRYAQRMV